MTKKIAVLAANGKAGKLIVAEALNRGFDVTAVVRSANQTTANKVVEKDILDLTAEDLAGFDAVVSAFGAWTEDTLPQHSAVMAHLVDILSGSKVRLLVVGGAGSLYVNSEHTLTLSETPDFPDVFQPVAKATGDAFDIVRTRDNVAWTYVSPAADFQAEGERTGSYILAGEEFTVNEAGESVLSYADYAIAMIDEIESGNHVRERISVLKK